MDYGKLSEQYGSFLVAIGGVSITVFALVLSIWSVQSRSGKGRAPAFSNKSQKVNTRAALIVSLIIATFCCFVGAHLMAETAAFISGITKGVPKEGVGERQFLLASVNIYVGLSVCLFAIVLLATEYRKENRNARGIRSNSLVVFGAVVVCVLWWMDLSVRSRVAAPSPLWGQYLWLVPSICIVSLGLPCLCLGLKKKRSTCRAWLRYRKGLLDRKLLPFVFLPIVLSTFLSLVFLSRSLLNGSDVSSSPNGGEVSNGDVLFFVLAITLTCVSLVGYLLLGKRNECRLLRNKTTLQA